MSTSISGLDLARAFYHEAVRPVLAKHHPRLPHSAALLGSGSEALGFDDAVSRDHNWGPRLQLFLSAPDHARSSASLAQSLRRHLPYQFRGYATNWSAPKHEKDDQGTQLLAPIASGEVNHRVETLTIDSFMRAHFGLGSDCKLRAADWLSIPQQKLLTFTSGAVFHDALGLESIRQRFAFYPRDVWLYLLACGWQRIAQDEHLAPRAGAVGDELGSRIIAGRLARSIVLLCFLMERAYAPYPKWLGSAFRQLDCANELAPILEAVQLAGDYRERERHLCAVWQILNRLHNNLGLTQPIAPSVQEFHGRGFMVGSAWRYTQALLDCIAGGELQKIAARSLIGGIDQFSDNTDLREAVHLRGAIADLYAG
ncbi:MAG: DUF4037 domain-containing protein [Chloroflexi bacterium]|nr:DUF4037 domain-containing protein [Chloroflexota bacterium]MCY4248781.1 DUF4037 domain-containing protein [Chloroflexota bacterium]